MNEPNYKELLMLRIADVTCAIEVLKEDFPYLGELLKDDVPHLWELLEAHAWLADALRGRSPQRKQYFIVLTLFDALGKQMHFAVDDVTGVTAATNSTGAYIVTRAGQFHVKEPVEQIVTFIEDQFRD